MLSLEQKIAVNLQESSTTESWREFSLWINELGKQLSNDYYLSLWNSIYLLLEEKGYFAELKMNMEINELKIAFYKKDQQTLLSFLIPWPNRIS